MRARRMLVHTRRMEVYGDVRVSGRAVIVCVRGVWRYARSCIQRAHEQLTPASCQRRDPGDSLEFFRGFLQCEGCAEKALGIRRHP
jgi:hypothetical protein